MDWAVALLMLTGMEIILGIDNIIFLSILIGALPKERQKVARYIGLGLALGARMLLFGGIRWVMGFEKPLFHLSSVGAVPRAWLHDSHVDAVTGRDLVLLGGGLFLIAKSVLEIHKKMSGDEEAAEAAATGATSTARKPSASFPLAIAQIVVLDLVFSLDSIISAIGMVKEVWIMIVAMTVAVAFMALFAGKVSRFIETHPTFKMLALSFLVLVGVVLIAEGSGAHISRGYIYVTMAFALAVEVLNLRARSRRAKKAAQTRKLRSASSGSLPATAEV